MVLSERRLNQRAFNYDVVGPTAPDTEPWRPPAGWRTYEHTVRLGSGADLWDKASSAVLSWGVKTRSRFTAMSCRQRWIRVREPAEIIATVATSNRAALAYGTLEGHPVSAEEAFIVSRDDDGNVSLTLRSLTRAGRGHWRGLFPLTLTAQRIYRCRHLRALRHTGR